MRARPKADLDHAAPADGAQIEAMAGEHCVTLAIIGVLDGRGRLRRFEGGTYDGKLGDAACVRQKAEVANAAEAFWQHMDKEAAGITVTLHKIIR